MRKGEETEKALVVDNGKSDDEAQITTDTARDRQPAKSIPPGTILFKNLRLLSDHAEPELEGDTENG
ncbi:hypothetical protein NHJ6243_008194 [Beauveria neobassiana]